MFLFLNMEQQLLHKLLCFTNMVLAHLLCSFLQIANTFCQGPLSSLWQPHKPDKLVYRKVVLFFFKQTAMSVPKYTLWCVTNSGVSSQPCGLISGILNSHLWGPKMTVSALFKWTSVCLHSHFQMLFPVYLFCIKNLLVCLIASQANKRHHKP